MPQIRSGNLKFVDADLSALTSVYSIDLTSNALTSADISKCDGLVKFVASNNKLTELKFGTNAKLQTLNISGNSAEENQIAVLEAPSLPALSMLNFNNNPIEAIDFSKFPALKQFYALNSKLTKADFTPCADINYVNVNNNPLETLTLPAVSTKKSSFFLLNTYLDFAQLQSVLDFAAQKTGSKVNAATLIIPCEGNSRVIDLSAYYKHGDNISTFAWVDGAKQEIPATAYTAENGVFTLL